MKRPSVAEVTVSGSVDGEGVTVVWPIGHTLSRWPPELAELAARARAGAADA